MKPTFFGLALFFSLNAQATPGDISCVTEDKGKEVEVVVWRDESATGIALTKMIINVDGTEVTSFVPEDGMENVGTEQEPFANYVIKGENEVGSAKIRFPEAATDQLILTVKVPGQGIALTEVEATCQL